MSLVSQEAASDEPAEKPRLEAITFQAVLMRVNWEGLRSATELQLQVSGQFQVVRSANKITTAIAFEAASRKLCSRSSGWWR